MKYKFATMAWISIGIASCHDAQRMDQFHTALNEIARINYFDSSTVIMLNLDTLKTYTPKFNNTVIGHDTIEMSESPPKSQYAVYITQHALYSIAQSKLIDSTEARHLFNQIGNIPFYNLDKNKVNCPTLSRADIRKQGDKANPEHKFDTLRRINNDKTYIRISQPLFTRDGKTLIFHMSKYCGPDCGSGHRIIMKFEKDKWRIKMNQELWIN